jgi:hypothetical protein
MDSQELVMEASHRLARVAICMSSQAHSWWSSFRLVNTCLNTVVVHIAWLVNTCLNEDQQSFNQTCLNT